MPKSSFTRETDFVVAVCPCGWSRKCRTDKHLNMMRKLHWKTCPVAKSGKRTETQREEGLRKVLQIARETTSCPQTNLTQFREALPEDTCYKGEVKVVLDNRQHRTAVSAKNVELGDISGLLGDIASRHSGIKSIKTN
jgi:hypothetical protein